MDKQSSVPLQARSVATRSALLDAAIEALCANGYASLTTNDISRRAGVSRGAQLHHFPSKAELVAAAVEHLLRRRIRDFDNALRALEPAGDHLDAAIDVVWSMFDGPAFVAWAELWVAARTDPGLAAAMVDVDRRFTDDTRIKAVELLSGLGAYDPATLEMVRDFAFAVMGGVALQRLVPRGQRPAADYLAVLKSLAHGMLDEQRTAT